MSEAFDFRALVARAADDNPDAAVYAAIDRMADAREMGRQAWRGTQRHIKAGQAHLDALSDLAAAQPETIEGLLAKLRWAADRMHRAPIFEAQHSALLNAIAWLEPKKPTRPHRRTKGGAA
ncbi:hypothetical protein EAH89_26165 [Roseomonas nepalensis]|uniref:Uncharacterized protein n=1 Tax=Muricoccus nepalensis TaxID=1854500 RepID=A0A502F8L2_9PROT|nr:hypothetical protein [Roseomonas nepalensis]TPG45690.1 hypothetical protein EAH89_26165 [Roseomonas nepalensis]